jgi:hypothetical protein
VTARNCHARYIIASGCFSVYHIFCSVQCVIMAACETDSVQLGSVSALCSMVCSCDIFGVCVNSHALRFPRGGGIPDKSLYRPVRSTLQLNMPVRSTLQLNIPVARDTFRVRLCSCKLPPTCYSDHPHHHKVYEDDVVNAVGTKC